MSFESGKNLLCKEQYQGAVARKSGTENVLGDDINEKYRYDFSEAWPCR
jgi:hypothetical protein